MAFCNCKLDEHGWNAAGRFERSRKAIHSNARVSVTAPQSEAKIGGTMFIRDPEKNFEELWEIFHHRYPFFELRNVDWRKQFDIYRSRVTSKTGNDQLFDIFCQMLAPLNAGDVEREANVHGLEWSWRCGPWLDRRR